MIGPIPPDWAVDVASVRTREVLPGVWRLRLPSAYPHIDHSNAYALAGGDRLTLVDCGSGGDPSTFAALERALAETGHRVEQIDQLVLTHHHSDHIGSAATIAARSGCTVWAHPAREHFTDARRHPDEIRARRRRRSEQEGVPEEWLELYASVDEELEAIDGVAAIDRPAVDGAVVPSGLGPWTVIETPGHAPSHVALYQPERRWLVSADLIFAGFAPHYDYGNTPDPVAEFLASLDRIAAVDADWAMPGHGRPMTREEIAVAVRGHRAGVHAQLDRVREALHGGATNGWQVLQAVDPEIARDPIGCWIFGEMLCYLRHLRLRGEVERTLGSDGRFVHRPVRRAGNLDKRLVDFRHEL